MKSCIPTTGGVSMYFTMVHIDRTNSVELIIKTAKVIGKSIIMFNDLKNKFLYFPNFINIKLITPRVPAMRAANGKVSMVIIPAP